HDADATHEQGQRRNASQKYGQNPAGRKLSLYYVLRARMLKSSASAGLRWWRSRSRATICLVASGMASRETAEQKMSSSQNVPVILFCTVAKGITIKSS